ncbi:MAG: hypothetical protein HKO09_06145 [Croceitalea sp.]|nr:hypothetical protein [Croceitalea sp.]
MLRFIVASILFFGSPYILSAQLDEFSVMGLPTGTAAEITAIAAAKVGDMAYASDESNLYVFDGSTWVQMEPVPSSRVYMGYFIINSTGSITVGSLPFQPSNISFVAHANIEGLNINADNGVNNNNGGIANAYGTANGFARDDGGSIVQQRIYVGGSGNSINDISRYASSSHCIGIRYSNQNGDNLGITRATMTSFNSDGFTVNVDSFADGLVVIFHAYR